MTSPSDLSLALAAQRRAFMSAGAPPLQERLAHLQALKQMLIGHRERFVAAVNDDFGHRARQETLLMDIATSVDAINYLCRRLPTWLRPERRAVDLKYAPASAQVIYQPRGVVGIMSPWNFPVALALTPLATALAAGNRAMLKPSEASPATTRLLHDTLAEIFLPDRVSVIDGGVDVGIAFSRLAFDHMLFTGSTSVGRAVMRAASEHLVPVTLELGGKSPVLVEQGSDLQLAARRIAHGKLANAGQTCIAPDYVLIAERDISGFVSAYRSAVATLYPNIMANQHYTAIINDRQFERLQALLTDATRKGAEVIDLGSSQSSESTTHARTFSPTLLLNVTDDMRIMQEEIFGPLLPLVRYSSITDAITRVNARPRPLALYYFGSDSASRKAILDNTTSGGVAFNDTIIQYAQVDLPFGGVGDSGMGAYHGYEGFKSMSHAKSVFRQSALTMTGVMRPPFGALFDAVIKYLLR
jgi:coniferyl-aldehyde dehydrogenase